MLFYTILLNDELLTTILYCDPATKCGDRNYDKLLTTILYCDPAMHCGDRNCYKLLTTILYCDPATHCGDRKFDNKGETLGCN